MDGRMEVAPHTPEGCPRVWPLVIALGLSVPHAVHAQDFWWLRVAQSLTAPVDVATVAQVAEALPPGTLIGPLAPPIADPTSLALDARLPPVPRAVNALAQYLGAARAAGAANVATVTGPWFVQTTLAIKALRRHGVIQDQSECDAVVGILMDSVLVGPGVSPTVPAFQAFAQTLHVVACASAERLYVRAESLMPSLAAAGAGPSPAGPAVPAAGRIAYNAFPDRPMPVTHCTLATSPFPVWVLSDGAAVTFTSGSTNPVGHLLADYSHHYPVMLVLTGPPQLVYGANFNGALYRRTGTGPVTPAGQCE
jgi:hypothetical protein